MEFEKIENAVVSFDASFFTNETNAQEMGHYVSFTMGRMIVVDASFIDVLRTRGALEAMKSQCLFPALLQEALSQKSHPLDRVYALRDLLDEKLNDSTSPDAHLQLLLVGVAALYGFVQANWTGPPLTEYEPLFGAMEQSEAIADFHVDGEQFYKKTVAVELLLLARAILVQNIQNFRNSRSKSLWSARCSFKQQELLSGPSETLRVQLTAQLNKAVFAYPEHPLLSLEFGLVYNYYQDSVRAREHFFKAKEESGLVADLSGMLGRRTKYQTFDTAQLVLLARSQGKSDAEKKADGFKNEVKHEDTWDEGSLPQPKLKEEDATADMKILTEENLTLMDQCILLALCLNVKNENPRHGLTWEEMKAYVDRILKNPNNWMIHSMGLLVKSRLESLRERTADRAAMQIQVLVDQFNEIDQEDSKVPVRMKHIFSLAFPPKNQVELEVGRIYLNLGIARTAMAIFERLEYWGEVIECLQICKDFDAAHKLVKERMAVDGETPELLCILGDVMSKNEDKIAAFQKAWEVSKGRSARAKRQLGIMAMNENKFKDAIAHFKQALAINPQYSATWFRLGVCGMASDDYQTAAAAFARVTVLSPEDGEAWSNLASCLYKMDKLKEAYSAYKEALRHNENWRIWENFIIVCMKTNRFGEAIYSLNRLLDIKDKHVDINVLGTLVQLVTDKELSSEETIEVLHKQLREYMARLTSKISNDPALWHVYAFYYERLDNAEKASEFRQRQVRALSSAGGWEHDPLKFQVLVTATEKLIRNQIRLQDKNPLHATILSIRSWLRRAQDVLGESEDWKLLQEILKKAEEAEAQK